MSDITMCSNAECDRRKQCYRAMAETDILQSWSDFGKDCEDNDFRNQWEIKDNNIYIDKITDILIRC